jgi:HEPN domain-containing protein
MGKEEILKQWLDKGHDDLRAAEYLSTMHNPTPDEIICYLCQQSAEKYLKSFIFSQDIEPDKTHDLNELLKVCQKYNAEFSILSSQTLILKRYAVMTRYPNELGITQEDMKNALLYAKTIQNFVMKIFGNEIEPDKVTKE